MRGPSSSASVCESTIALEVGIHNAALAITIALSPLLLGNATMGIPPMIYGLTMVVTAVGFGVLMNRGAPRG